MRKQEVEQYVEMKAKEIREEFEEKLAEAKKKAAAIDAKTPLWKEVLFGVLVGIAAAFVLTVIMKLVGVI